MNAYGRDPLDHGLYAHAYGEKSYLPDAHVHGRHRHHDGHDRVRVRKHGDGCDGDGACGYALVSHVCGYAHGHGRGYERVRGGVYLHS